MPKKRETSDVVGMRVAVQADPADPVKIAAYTDAMFEAGYSEKVAAAKACKTAKEAAAAIRLGRVRDAVKRSDRLRRWVIRQSVLTTRGGAYSALVLVRPGRDRPRMTGSRDGSAAFGDTRTVTVGEDWLRVKLPRWNL